MMDVNVIVLRAFLVIKTSINIFFQIDRLTAFESVAGKFAALL